MSSRLSDLFCCSQHILRNNKKTTRDASSSNSISMKLSFWSDGTNLTVKVETKNIDVRSRSLRLKAHAGSLLLNYYRSSSCRKALLRREEESETFINSGKQFAIINRQSKWSNYVIVVMLRMLLVFLSLFRRFFRISTQSQRQSC